MNMCDNESVSASGINNTVNYKSNNVTNNMQINNFNINDSFLNTVAMSLINADYQKSECLISNFHSLVKCISRDPQWKFEIRYEGERIFLVEKPVDDQATKGLPERMEVRLSIPIEYNCFESINKIIDYGQRKQEIIKFEVKELKRFIGTHLVEHLESQYENNYIIEIPPTPFPVTKAKMILGNEFIIDDLYFQITEVIDENRIRISNKNDTNKKIFIEFIVNLETHCGESVNIHLPKDKYGNVESTLLRESILSRASKGTNLKVYFDDSLIMDGNISIDEYDGSDDSIELLNIIKKIEDKFSIIFNLPDEVNQSDIEIISEINHICEKGVIYGHVTTNFEMTSSDAKGLRSMVQLDDEGKHCQIHKITQDMKYILFDKIICVGDVVSIYPPMKLLDKEKLIKKLEFFSDGDLIKISYAVIDETKFISIYKNFSNIDEETYIHSQYLMKINETVTIQDYNE